MNTKKSGLSFSNKYTILESLFFVHSGIIGATYMLYLLDQGLTIFQANIVSSIFNVAQIIMEIPSGAISDIIGERKTSLYSGLSLVIAMLLFFIGTHTTILIFAQIFWGISYALASGSLESWVVKKTNYRKAELDHLFATNAKVKNIAMILGSFLGSYLAGVSLNYIWIFPLFSAVIFLILADQFMKDEKVPNTMTSQNVFVIFKVSIIDAGKKIQKGFNTVKQEKSIQTIYLFNLLVAVCFSPMLLFWSLYLNGLHNGKDYWFLAWMWLLIKIANISGNTTLQYLTHKKERLTIFSFTMILVAIASFSFGLSNNIFVVLLLILVLECAYGIIVPIQRALINDNIDDSQRATLISFGVVFTATGKFFSGMLYGLIAEISSVMYTWIFGGIISIILLLFVINKQSVINGKKNS